MYRLDDINMQTRDDSFDILKGVLIILVIFGHLVETDTFLHRFIFSFHMPVFFMITGMLSHFGGRNMQFLRKRAKSYVIPYFSWSVCLFLLFWIENPIKYIVRILYAGAMNTTQYTYPFWFICCLFISSVVSNFCWKKKELLFLVLVVWLICWYSFLCDKKIPPLPWSLEVVPFAILYIFIGYFSIKIENAAIKSLGNCFYSVFFVLALFFLAFSFLGYIDFSITMKTVEFYHFPLDIIVPVVFYYTIKGCCIRINKYRGIKEAIIYVGRSSLVIMFTHASVFYLCGSGFSGIHFLGAFIIKVLFALIVGVGLYSFFLKNKYFAYLFLGKNN